jgi:hyaluronate lyase
MRPSSFVGLLSIALISALPLGCGDDGPTALDDATDGPTSPQGPRATPPNVAPVAAAGPDHAAECASHAGSTVTLTSAGSGDSDGQVVLYEWFENGKRIATGPTPTVTLAFGVHTILLRTTDDDGGTNDDVVVVDIRDTEAPTVAMIVSPTRLWPPNHTMHIVAQGVSARDVCDSAPALRFSIGSDEPENGLGDGDTAPDWAVQTASASLADVLVRAERSGLGDGRVYTISATATDRAGNRSNAAAGTVTVPHNQ